MVVTQGVRVALVGVVIGLFAAVSVIMIGVALFASYLPARRASAVDPVEANGVE